jgi:hypothetical protein
MVPRRPLVYIALDPSLARDAVAAHLSCERWSSTAAQKGWDG